MQSIKGSQMGLGMIALSGILLFNPVVGYLDVLPDAIGFLLLWVGLYRLADLNDRIGDAMRRFRILFFIGVGELLVTYLLYVAMPARAAEMNPYERPVSILLFSFVMLLCRWLLLIPALRDLFGGLQRLSEKYDGEALLAEKNGKTRFERLIRHSTVFVVLQSLLSVLPEASILTSFEHDAKSTSFLFDWYEFIELFRLAAGLICAVIGVIWLASFLNCCRHLLREHEWIGRVRNAYVTEILPQTDLLAVRRYSAVFLLLNVAILFTFHLRVDHHTALPGAVAAILTLIALRVRGRRAASEGKCRAACYGLTAVSTVQLVVNAWFLKSFLPEAALYQTDAYYGFLVLRILEAAEAIVTLLFVWILLKVIFEWMREEVSVEYAGDALAETLSQRATERLHREFAKRFAVIFILFAAATVVNIADAIFQLRYGWIWLISFALTFAAVWIFYSLMHDLMSEIKNRYLSSTAHKSV